MSATRDYEVMIDRLLTQLRQMQPLFDDADGEIATTIDDAEKLLAKTLSSETALPTTSERDERWVLNFVGHSRKDPLVARMSITALPGFSFDGHEAVVTALKAACSAFLATPLGESYYESYGEFNIGDVLSYAPEMEPHLAAAGLCCRTEEGGCLMDYDMQLAVPQPWELSTPGGVKTVHAVTASEAQRELEDLLGVAPPLDQIRFVGLAASRPTTTAPSVPRSRGGMRP
jgi:hypothetical protein